MRGHAPSAAIATGRPLLAVAADRFHGAAFHRLFAKIGFVVVFRLLEHVTVSAIVVARKIGRCRFTAQVAIDALVIDVIFS